MSGDEKTKVREHVRQRLAETTDADRRAWSAAICKRLIEWATTSGAAMPMVYLPTAEEAGVDCYTAWRIKRGLGVCGPRVDWETWAMAPLVIEDLDAGVEIRRHGIREPIGTAKEIEPASIDVVLVPGVAFDEQGQRVGRGAGCYDRFLARNDLMAGILAIGVCFEAQIVETAPAEAHDAPLGAIITEERIILPMKQ